MSWAEFIVDSGLWVLCFFKFFLGMAILSVSHTTFSTLLIGLTAGVCGTTFFYFLSEYFMRRSHRNRITRIKKGKAKPKKKFTRLNKLLVKVKQRIGLIGIAFITPTIVSIPVGTIIMAKFYKNNRWAYPSLIISLVLWGVAMVSVAKLFPDFFKQVFPSAYE
ncbi:MAG: hypothetical protein AB8B53_11830 [Flavobacteriales bacterium]